ncbi:hypothetical protein ABZ671_00625 [Micromonospora sp. NPDC006766]|uniref:hypothetical protein n=1 Tax=Micromonospora sp. NPDC006766 TaxID=3154778 RepID=UPI0033C21EE0
MAITLVVALSCDRCGERYPVRDAALANAGKVREAAERAGWQVVGPGSRTDRCPTHHTRSKVAAA